MVTKLGTIPSMSLLQLGSQMVASQFENRDNAINRSITKGVSKKKVPKEARKAIENQKETVEWLWNTQLSVEIK